MRYTFMSDGYAAVNNDVCYEDQNEDYCGSAIDKLSTFEDAEEQGRLVILPCKVGDMVWWIPPASFTWLELRPYCCMIVSMTITENKKRERKKKYRLAELRDGKTIDNVRDVDFEDFGKTVFLTREAAEAAMMKGEKKDV